MKSKFTEAEDHYVSKNQHLTESIKLNSYELKLSTPTFSGGESLDFVPFMQKINPTLMHYANKAMELGRSEIDSKSNISKQELGEILINKVYPKLIKLDDLDDAERLLEQLYTAYPQSKEIMSDIKDQFDPNSGGIVFAIPPVIVAGVVVYAVGYAIGYFLS